jgi:hypothetical protein
MASSSASPSMGSAAAGLIDWSTHIPAKSGRPWAAAPAASRLDRSVVAGSTTAQPPSGSGQGDEKSGSDRSTRRGGAGGSVSVNRPPSQVPVSS